MSGQATNVLVYRELNGRSGRRYGLSPVGDDRVGGGGTYDEYFLPYGLLTPGQIFGSHRPPAHARVRHHEKDLGIAIACRNRANANPAAQMHGRPLTMDDYLGGADDQLAAAPVRLLPGDRRRLRRRRHEHGTGAGRASTAGADPGGRPGSVVAPAAGHPVPGVLRGRSRAAGETEADTLYRRAGLGPADIDVAQLYDCFTITVLMQLEDFGFCAKGEGGPFASTGRSSSAGSCRSTPAAATSRAATSTA